MDKDTRYNLYKCRRCGEKLMDLDNPVTNPVDKISLKDCAIHKCRYGGYGVADHIGVESLNEWDEREGYEVLMENNPNII